MGDYREAMRALDEINALGEKLDTTEYDVRWDPRLCNVASFDEYFHPGDRRRASFVEPRKRDDREYAYPLVVELHEEFVGERGLNINGRERVNPLRNTSLLRDISSLALDAEQLKESRTYDPPHGRREGGIVPCDMSLQEALNRLFMCPRAQRALCVPPPPTEALDSVLRGADGTRSSSVSAQKNNIGYIVTQPWDLYGSARDMYEISLCVDQLYARAPFNTVYNLVITELYLYKHLPTRHPDIRGVMYQAEATPLVSITWRTSNELLSRLKSLSRDKVAPCVYRLDSKVLEHRETTAYKNYVRVLYKQLPEPILRVISRGSYPLEREAAYLLRRIEEAIEQEKKERGVRDQSDEKLDRYLSTALELFHAMFPE